MELKISVSDSKFCVSLSAYHNLFIRVARICGTPNMYQSPGYRDCLKILTVHWKWCVSGEISTTPIGEELMAVELEAEKSKRAILWEDVKILSES